MFFIGPPFGNYVSLPQTVRIRGSFTLEKRDGLFMQVMRTLRYSFEHGGWINKIGLRNGGIDSVVNNYNKEDVYSIAILHENEIEKLKNKIPDDMNIELNVSCPNAEKKMVNSGLDGFLNGKRRWCIVKVPPTCSSDKIDGYYKQGFRQFHCSNTIPTERGGLSGKSLIPYNNKLIKDIRSKYKDAEIISGGGVEEWKDVVNYKSVGADHFAVSTLCFNPIKFAWLYMDYLKKK